MYSTSQKSARPKSALRRQKVQAIAVDREDLDMPEGELLDFGQDTNMIDVESISYDLEDIANSKFF